MGDGWREREVWIFLLLIVIVNALFVGGIDAGILPERLYNLGRFLLLGLTLAVVIFAVRGFAGLRELVRSLTVWRIDPRW